MSWFGAPAEYWLTRLVFQRALAAVYLNAFVIALNQARPLVGAHGLLPTPFFLSRVTFWDAPGVFWVNSSDTALLGVAIAGVVLSLLALTGVAESFGAAAHLAVWGLLWLLYLSFVGIGQVFWGFGWETLLLETGFLTIFLGAANQPTPVVVIWLLRWVVFRVMFGAGMIKLRGDPCWRDLTCMVYHYETQPLPNPLSWFLHHLPVWAHKVEVAATHVVEVIVPFAIFAPPPFRYIAGAATILFQCTLILSGNLSWLNYITIVLAISCFDDALIGRLLPLTAPVGLEPSFWFHRIVAYGLGLVVLVLSYRPALNLISPGQLMNASFEPLHLVNTYGAFGSITRVRREVILEGTDDPDPGPTTTWREYQFKCKPGDVTRRPCVLSPYHYKIDWQMWFAAMGPYYQHPWILPLIGRLLQADAPTLALMAPSPFGTAKPKFVRAELYEYHFTKTLSGGDWWDRQRLDVYLPPLNLEHPQFKEALGAAGVGGMTVDFDRPDAVVVGTGPNGLAAAVTLARAGLAVLAIEAKDTIGGGTRTSPLTEPGFLHDVCSAVHPMGVASPFFRELDLAAFGLEWVHPEAPMAHPLPDGTAAVLERSVAATAATLGADGPAYQRLMGPFVAQADAVMADFVGPLRPPRHPLLALRFGLKALQPASRPGAAHLPDGRRARPRRRVGGAFRPGSRATRQRGDRPGARHGGPRLWLAGGPRRLPKHRRWPRPPARRPRWPDHHGAPAHVRS